MSKVQVLALSNKHRDILEHMIANPTKKLGDVAATFDVSQSWLSVLIHSDAFQEELAKKRDEVFHPAMMTLQERLTGMAHLALDKLGEEIDNDQLTPGQLIETSSSVLDRLGYGTKAAAPGGVTQNNIYLGSVPATVVHEARQAFGQRTPELIEQIPESDEESSANEDRPVQQIEQTSGDGSQD